MAITFLHVDGFEHNTVSGDRYSSAERSGTPGTANGAYGYGRALSIYASGNWLGPLLSGTPYTTIFTAMTFSPQSNSTTNEALLQFYDDVTSTVQVTISIQFSNVSGKFNLYAYRGTTAGTLLATASNVIPAAFFWCHVSVMCTVDPTNGRVKVNIDGTNVIDFTGNTQNTANTRIDRVRIPGVATNTYYCDNWIIATGLPTDPMLPEIRVYAQFPTGNDAVQFAVTGSAANWSAVNESGPNGDTSYTYSSTVGQQDTFTFSAPSIGATVHALQVCYDARRDDAGPRAMRAVVKPTTTAYDSGADDTLTSTYYIYKKIWMTNPETAAAWTPAQATAAKFGYKLTV